MYVFLIHMVISKHPLIFNGTKIFHFPYQTKTTTYTVFRTLLKNMKVSIQ
jgi:hypothetical protein